MSTPSPTQFEVQPGWHVPMSELEFTFARSSGPGGQNVNKVNSKAQLRWSLRSTQSVPPDVRARLEQQQKRRMTQDGDLLLTSQRFRDQGRNVTDCLEKLRALLIAAATVAPPRKPTRPSKASKRRRLNDKKLLGDKKSQRRMPRDD